MAQVTVSVNGRAYAVGCDDGAEDHVRYLAEYLDQRVKELVGAVGQVGEARLLLMAALTVSDDLANAVQEQEELRAEVERLRETLRRRPPAEGLAPIIDRLEKVADRLDST
ncbi:MAG: cell division protein ZapA [Alphaproteobacteria bacterium]|nr:cell division protein ZapA [Alphaproteobacteria bacterium]